MLEKPKDGEWLSWVNARYPFEKRWEDHLLTRIERPSAGSEDQLNDLRGVSDRGQAVHLAQLWFHCTENASSIYKQWRSDKLLEAEKHKRSMIRNAKLALEGKLGESKDEREGAQATAQTFLRINPEVASWDTLRDWSRMHDYARRLLRGEEAVKPQLLRDRRTLKDIHDSIPNHQNYPR